jgi:hypothetical protein
MRPVLERVLARRIASNWMKGAGMLQAPPRMVQVITDWVSEHLPGGSTPLPKGQTVSKTFPLDLRGWKYGDRLQEVLEYAIQSKRHMRDTLQKMMESNPAMANDFMRNMLADLERDIASGKVEKDIRVDLVHPARPTSTGADWQPFMRTITIYLRSDFRPRDVVEIVEHEMRHVGQTLLSQAVLAREKNMVKEVKDLAGLPSRKVRNPGSTEYHLIDAEFYPNLADAIERIREALDRVDPVQRVNVFKMMTGQKTGGFRVDPFFLSLKRGSAGKYRKALSVAYGELF